MSDTLFDCANTTTGDSIFDLFSQIDANVCINLNRLAGSHATEGLFNDLILPFIAIEVLIVLIYLVIDSAPNAILRGVEMLLIAAFVAGITQPTVWSGTVIPLVKGVTSYLVAPIVGEGGATELKGRAMSAFGDVTRTLMSPSNLTTSRNITAPIISQQNAAANTALVALTKNRSEAMQAYQKNTQSGMSEAQANTIYNQAKNAAVMNCRNNGGGSSCR